MAIRPFRPSRRLVRLVALGATVEVQVAGGWADSVVAEIERVWHLCTAPAVGHPVARVCVAHDHGTPSLTDLDKGVVEGSNLPDLMQMLTQAVTRAAIDAQAGRLVMLHAAGIQNPVTGATVALVGQGGAGKTTLIRKLCPGRGYITDETVAITGDNTVLPYPKPLSVRREPRSPWKDETDPVRFGVLAPAKPATLGAVVILDRQDGYVGPPALQHVHTLDAIAALTPETSHLPKLDKPLQRMAALCDSVGGVVRVTYAEAADLAPMLAGWLEEGT